YYLLGANTLAAMSYAAAPQWFWEGDAVATETAFTKSGRGRIPNFGVVFKANLLEGRKFNYHKQYLRSYKHNIPDHYVFGYHMVNYLREKTGDAAVWGKITKRSWSVPFIPFAFSNAVKKESGMYVTKLYESMVSDLTKRWKEEMEAMQFTPFESVNQRKSSAYTDYLYPHQLENGDVLAMRRGIGDIEEFVNIQGSKPIKLFTPGIMNETGMISVRKDKIAWNEFHYDPRWGVRNYSVIKVYDINTKQLTVVSEKSRYGGAALSPDATQVATVRTDTDYKHALIIIDINSKRIVKEFSNPENAFYAMPRWSDDGSKIVALKITKPGKSVVSVSMQGEESVLLPESNENVGNPVLNGNYLFFNSPVSGIDNIYTVDLTSLQRFQVTSSKYGAYNPSISNDRKFIFYNEQTKDGMDVVKIPFDPSSWQAYEVKPEAKSFYQHLVEQEGRPNLLDSIPQQEFDQKKYSKLKGLVNPYSWGPFFNNSFTAIDVGITSKDVLSTTTINAGYRYDLNERTGQTAFSLSFQGWFPIFDFSFSDGDREIDEGDLLYGKIIGPDTVAVIENLTFKWHERTVETGLRIPLVTTRSRFIGNFSIGNSIGYTAVSGFQNSIDGGGRIIPSNLPQYIFRDYVDNGKLVFNHFTMTGQRILKQSRRDINSKWGQAFFLDAYGAPFGGDFSGSQFSFYGLGYFPGMFKHHSIWGYWGYQSSKIERAVISSGQGLNNYIFRNEIPLPRGQSISRAEKFYSMSANYTLPVWYPDIAIGPLLNIQRIRFNGFVDYGFGSNPTFGTSQTYLSTGFEAKCDFNIFRFLPQLNMGIRYSYGIDPAVTKVEILIGTFNF
ncbi:MAG: hypothetical protein L0Y35_08650, partial [Flammeovirgaceae bacterium]|nr:hypothetical protein [Flammeovirgaceae bacterium]